jgi:hypothetical protein
MNEFLLLALVIIYLAISYVPVSGTAKGNWQSHGNERTSHNSADADDNHDSEAKV